MKRSRPMAQQLTCDHAHVLDSVDLEQRPIRTCSDCGARLPRMDLNVDDIAEIVHALELRLRWYDSRDMLPGTRERRTTSIDRALRRVKELRRG